MKMSVTNEPISQLDCDALILGVDANQVLCNAASQLSPPLDAWLKTVIEREKFEGDLGTTLLLMGPAEQALEAIVLVGTGPSDHVAAGAAFRAASAGVRALAKRRRKHVACALASDPDANFQRAAVAGASSALAGQDLYRSERSLRRPARITWLGFDQDALDAGSAIGNGVELTKRLVNEPPNKIYPESFADHAKELGSEHGFDVEVWDERKLKSERCNAILAVGAGSARPPRLVILRYNGGPNDEAPLALVGKGVTFDSGGLSIKPSDGMKDMKCDMGGAATVLGAVVAAAQMKLPANVVGVIGLAENMLSGSSYKLGDVIVSRNGKTIEVLNTDAEGRVVLADALDVAVQQEPSNIVDLATLTGACMVALGMETAGLMSNDASWCEQVKRAAAAEDELVWELPMWEFFAKQIKSKVADIKNIGQGRWGGAITAAKFLEEFVGDVPWVHIDIAGPAFNDTAQPWSDAGASGVMVRTLVRLIEDIANDRTAAS